MVAATWDFRLASLNLFAHTARATSEESDMLRKLLTASICAAGVLVSAGVYAQAPATPDCAATATEKKLHGAALNSFMKKCERDAAASACDASAIEKKLAGAARTSFTKKCIKDATTKPTAQ